MTAADILRENGIKCSEACGRHYVTCPRCSPKRSRANQSKRCLGVTINDKGVHFGCAHCSWTGGAYFNSKSTNGKGGIVATYDYEDENGVLLFQVCRKADKTFPQRAPDGNGGWTWGTAGVRKALYRLPELIEDMAQGHVIVIAEGEKDVDSLRAGDVPATCSPGGAAKPGQRPKWRKEYSETLRGAEIVIVPDHDEPGYAHAEATARMSLGIARRVRMLKLAEHWPECPKRGDISDWLQAGHTREELDGLIERAPEYQPQTEDKPDRLPFISLVGWHGEPVPDRQWVVRDRIPANTVTLLSGDGGVGKTILGLHLSVAAILGRDWAGALPEPGPVLAVCCEDDEAELHRRLAKIIEHYGASFADLSDLHLISLAGQDALLATPGREGIMVETKLFRRVREAACDTRPKLIMLDNSADVFGGSENDRAQVRQFVGMLRGLAMATGAGVLLTSHPSLTGISTGTGLSGSTAWNASVRSRLYLKRAKTEKDEEPDPDLRVLEVMKANYGPVGESIPLRWQDGLFLPVAAPGSFENMARAQKIDGLFLSLLDRCIGQGRGVSDKKASNTYAPNRFVSEPEAKADRVTKLELADAMDRLFRAGAIHVASYGYPSRGWTRIERK